MEIEKIVAIANDFLINEFEVDGDEISNDAHFKKTLGLDSLDYIDLVVVIESNFGVKLGEADFKNIITFEDFYSAIQQKITEKSE
ncbi:phosphopantetheine-binding protein [Chryseobacterium wangxinyae]|uniref:acyl carrier protein n=1 Tax=Chryseobacterium sp. CY350 TaxID=2997336 RepID=UPI00226DDB31|nr:phosphopantetheine-binding protein [Chryseobacterium sp. CY350]MCY0976406.1 phosphopantetheine-binding protein [Chryseobacterium sp. CY350]WBZ93998.1 phosphopantetheine-binding protein [Chryseobacterium sp. CY350]